MTNILKNCVHKQWVTKVFSTKRRRGIATVVTSVILLSAVSIMGVFLIGWANTNLYTKEVALEATFSTKMNKLNEELVVEKIWFGTSPNIVNVTITNIGSIGFNITSIEIKNSTSILYFTISDGGIAPRDDYSIQETYNWNSGEVVDFTIITNRGNIFTSQEVT